jgi:subtilisin family serine protease
MTRLSPRRLLAAAAAGLTVLSVLTGTVTPASAGAMQAALLPKQPSNPAAGMRTITLITGDVVHVSDMGNGRLATQTERPHDATGGVRAEMIGKDLYVIPDEVVPYLAAGKLDRRLFDITTLLAYGYDDQHSDGIPMIVSYAKGKPVSAPAGSTRIRNLPSINGTVVRAPKKRARSVWHSIADTAPAGPRAASALPVGNGISKIWLDGRVRPALAESTAQIGAPQAWAAGFDGHGVTVAVLDTGYDSAHPDLAGRVSKAVSFVPDETPQDGNGHGTHTASTIAGSGAASGGAEKGVAPAADLIVGKVLSDGGFGDDSWVIAGMEWAARDEHAKVISMSLGSDMPSDGTDPLSMAVNRLTADYGSLFVIAAGNTGMEATAGGPGSADSALTVAAVDNSDALAWFSTRGPRSGDYALKPDIAAPGVDILAAKAGGTAETGYYQTMSGTSMATPHVAGAAAILAQEHPTWTWQQLKDALMSTSRQLGDTAYQVGAGRVDVAATVAASITATGSTYFGYHGWPQSSASPVDRTITYTNTGDADVTLNLTESAHMAGGPYDIDPGADVGVPAPDGMFTLSATTLTVPAHGAATLTATARPDMGAAGRRYLGQVIATDADGTTRARTQVGLYNDIERHNLHITLKDRAGHAAAGWVQIQVFGDSGDPLYAMVDESGQADIRLPARTYSAMTFLDVAGSHGPDSVGVAMLGDPEIVLDRDRVVNLDASRAREVTAHVPRRTEDQVLMLDWYRSDGAQSVVGIQYALPATVDSMFALPTRAVTTGSFEYEARWRKAYPFLTVTSGGRQIPALGQAGTALYDGRATLDVVYAGTGTPEEYAAQDVSGKAVLVRRSDLISGQARARAAADAGAALLFVVNDAPGKLLEYVGTDEGGYSTVPVASLTARVGDPLIAAAIRGRLRLGVEGVPNSPYVYDLVDPRPGRVPADLSYRPTPAELATVDMRFHGTTAYPGGDFRWDYRPYRTFATGFWIRRDMPGTRTDYVSAQKGTSWAESAVTGPDYALVSSAEVHPLGAGTRSTCDFFGPVTRPRDGGGFWSSTRYDGFVNINVQPWADGGTGHAGYLNRGGTDTFPDTLAMKVYQDGELVSTSDWASGSVYPVDPSQTIHFTLDLEASRDPAVFRLTPHSHTTWEVISRPLSSTGVDLMPVLQLDYTGIPSNLAGDVRGGRQSLRLVPSHIPDAVGAGRILGATLQVSFDDGATWRTVALTRSDGGWIANFTAPRSGFVSLKASAWDSAGNKITQEVTRAYGLTS